MSTLDDLIRQFEKFPGVGVRQAKRFAFHVLAQSTHDRHLLAQTITNLEQSVSVCSRCYRFFTTHGGQLSTCAVCSDPNRDAHLLMIVAHDNDIDAIERSRVYNGLYFVLGGTIPLLQQTPTHTIRGTQLVSRITDYVSATTTPLEIILGFSVNPDGENTARYVLQLLAQSIAEDRYRVTHLGRGLSTGSELEYADPETIREALTNRR